MVTASDAKSGAVIRREGELCRIVGVEHHGGGGKTASFVHLKLRSLRSGAVKEVRLAPDAKLEGVELARADMEFLYEEADGFVFMNTQSFEQVTLPHEAIGDRSRFLTPNMTLPVELLEGEPVSVVFPEAVELKVVTAPPGVHDTATSAMKTAVLENGMEILVPQFIGEGDLVRVATETGHYLERVRQKR